MSMVAWVFGQAMPLPTKVLLYLNNFWGVPAAKNTKAAVVLFAVLRSVGGTAANHSHIIFFQRTIRISIM